MINRMLLFCFALAASLHAEEYKIYGPSDGSTAKKIMSNRSAQAEQEALKERAKAEGWTFDVTDEPVEFFKGLKKAPMRSSEVPSVKFLKMETRVPAKFHLKQLNPAIVWFYDQGACGSCVYNAFGKALRDKYLLAGKDVPVLARQFIMDCLQRSYMCEGSWGDYVAKGMKESRYGGTPAESQYPYRARNQSCGAAPSGPFHPLKDFKQIDPSAKSILTAMYVSPGPIPVTVAASSAWSSYRGGDYNACDSMSTNHQVVISGWDCRTSVDAEGYCAFNADGSFKNRDGVYYVPNSWGNWNGAPEMITLAERNGRKCNNIAEEAHFLDIGIEPPKPVDGGWSEWSDWSECQNGLKYRKRSCTNPAPSNGGKDCVGASEESQVCSAPAPDNGTSPWLWVVIVLGALVLIGVGIFLGKASAKEESKKG